MDNSIIVKNITKSYKLYDKHIDRLKESLSVTHKKYHKDFLANHNLSFEIKRGEVVGIIGKNGSGKSTLLKMITGVLTPSSGSIEVKGKITALLELGAGFNPEMTGLENLYLVGSISGISEENMSKKIEEIVDFAEIGEFIHQPLKSYSSGMKARLGFALAINADPEILIIDEALSVGDSAFQRKCFAKIEHMCDSEEITVLFVSHAGDTIKRLCNRAILLHAGELILDGKPKHIINIYEKYMDSKMLNLVELQEEYKRVLQQKVEPQKKAITNSFYNPNMQSKSLMEYKENGAKISDIKLVDENQNLVNVIEKNRRYTYSYDIVYSEDYKNTRVNVMIKDAKGIIITGLAQFIDSVEKERLYHVEFSFVNRLNAGDYFFQCATNVTLFGEFILLHKITDNYMVKVTSESKEDMARGIVDMDFESSFS